MNPNIKPDELSVAESTLLDAANAVRERAKEHGHTERSFALIGEMWSSYIAHAFTIRNETTLRPHDVAMMMDLAKTARSVYGYSGDNFVDKAGYSALAAMLTPQPEKKVKKPTPMPIATPMDDLSKLQASIPSPIDGKR